MNDSTIKKAVKLVASKRGEDIYPPEFMAYALDRKGIAKLRVILRKQRNSLSARIRKHAALQPELKFSSSLDSTEKLKLIIGLY